MSRLPLRALYFPFSRCFSPLTLKRALLLFDEIIFVDPIAVDIAYDNLGTVVVPRDRMNIIYRSTAMGERRLTPKEFDTDRRWVQIRSEYEFLSSKKVVRLFDPSKLVRANGDLLAAASMHMPYSLIRAEGPINDPEQLVWIMPDKRIPQPVGEELSDRFFKSLRMYRTTLLDHHPYETEPYDLPSGYVAIQVDRAIPLLIDQALLVARETGAIPFTDDPFIASYMVQRFVGLATADTAQPGEYEQGERMDSIIFASLAMRTLTSVIDDADLRELSLEDVCSFKARLNEPLNRFRGLLWQLTYQLARTPGQAGFEREIRASVSEKIEQPLADLVADLQQIRRSALLSAAAEGARKVFPAAAAGIPTLTVGALTGLSATGLIIAAATTVLTGLGIAVPASIEAYERLKVDERNALFYLAQL
jgi:hypothetical protein